MNTWLCNDNYTFRLHPKIGTFGCYNDNGDYSKPFQNINIIFILIIILFAILIYKKNVKKNLYINNKNVNKNV